jgi:hypothetical protein
VRARYPWLPRLTHCVVQLVAKWHREVVHDSSVRDMGSRAVEARHQAHYLLSVCRSAEFAFPITWRMPHDERVQ